MKQKYRIMIMALFGLIISMYSLIVYEVTIEGDAQAGFLVTNTELEEEPPTPSEPDEDGDPLPTTATNIFNLLLIGLLLLSMGGILLVIYKSKPTI